uniref:NB-ARC domain-containing protein n=1 Tax=Leersia perrieri TaxID=77586 RepID=A0A0D9XVN5_9ORYZ
MAEIVLLLAIKKISIALANEVTNQASAQFAKHVVQLKELQGSMGLIMMELDVMHDFLCQMDIQSRGDQVYQRWLQKVRRVAYEMEDIVDEYMHLVGRQRDIGCCFYLKRSFRQPRYVLSLDRIASMVKETGKNLAHLPQVKDRWVTNISDTRNSNYSIVQRSQDLASSSRSLSEEDLVGIEDNKQKLVDWLEDGDTAGCIIVVHGMGGLGKTSLASAVYRKEQGNFDCHAWVSVSQTYTLDDILHRLIYDIFRGQQNAPSNIATMDMTALQDILKSSLEQKKYLIVLDDIWTPQLYHDLLGVLDPNLKGSKIVITTRNANIANLTIPERSLELQCLSEGDSWELFCRKAFLKQHEGPEGLKDLSKKIRLTEDNNQAIISHLHRLRCMIVLDKSTASSRILHVIVENSRYMSVLELSGLPIDKVPDGIGDLFNLRHLGLRGSKVKFLPDSIEKLSNLLTLDLAISEIQELPSGIVKLKKLRHLFADKENDGFGRALQWCNGVRLPKGLEQLIELQTLQALETHDDGCVRHLKVLCQMRSLRISGVRTSYCEGLCQSLHQMKFLSNIDIIASGEDEVLQLNGLIPLPPNLQRLALRGRLAQADKLLGAASTPGDQDHLRILYLSWSHLEDDPLPSLSRWSRPDTAKVDKGVRWRETCIPTRMVS